MGSITSLIDGSTLHYNELVTVTYDSGALAFGAGAGEVATLVFEQNGVPKSTRYPNPSPAPATYTQSWALPSGGATALIKVHAKNTMGLVLETVQVTINLIPYAAANCAGATGQTMTDLTLNGTIAGIPAGGSARFRYGTANGGPYATDAPATPYVVGAVSAAVTGLSAGTVYYYVLEILDAAGVAVAVSPQCSGQTLLDASQAGPACPVPPYVDDCPPKQVYTVGGVTYVAYQFCDKANNTPILAVFRLCDGEPSGAPTYYDLTGQPYTPAGVVGLCDTAIDYEVLCDKGTNPNTRILALWDTSTTPPTLKYYTPATDGSLTVYVPVGPVGACPETDTEESQICYIALAAGTGYAAGDQLLQILFWDTGENPPTLTATIWRNQTQDALLATAPALADLGSCGSKDHEFQILCDQQPDGSLIRFLRRWAVDSTGTVAFVDTDLTGAVAYALAGTVVVCPDLYSESFCYKAITAGASWATDDTIRYVRFYDASDRNNIAFAGEIFWNATQGVPLLVTPVVGIDLLPCPPQGDDHEYQVLCDDTGAGAPARFLRRYTVDWRGNTVAHDTTLDGVTAYTVLGTVKACSATIEVRCACDDTDGDGVFETAYRRIVSIDPSGTVTILANYDKTLTTPYTPVSPGECDVPGDNLIGVRPKYRVLNTVDTWVLNADSIVPTISVTFTVVAVGNVLTPPTLETAEGTYPLYALQSLSFSAIYGRDIIGLKAPLVLTTNAGDVVSVAWTEEEA